MTKHLLKDRKGAAVTVKCSAKVEQPETTVWWREVTCPECQAKR